MMGVIVTRTDNSIKNSISTFVIHIVTIILLFIEHSFFIKILGIDYSGLDGLFTNVFTILNLIELGIGSSVTYNLYKYVKNNDKENIKSIMNFFRKSYNIIALLIFVIGLFITFFIPFFIKEVTVDINIYLSYILFLISIVSTYILSYKRNLIYANQKNYILNIIHLVYIFVLSILQIIIIYLTNNYYLYIVVKIICILLENIYISIKANKLYPYLKEKNIKQLKPSIKNSIVSRVKALIIHKTSYAITMGTDNILISSFLGLTHVGLYNNYYFIINGVSKLFYGIISSTIPSVGNLLVENNYEKNYDVFKKIRFLNFWIAVFTSICLTLLIEPFITMWLGKEFLLDKVVLFTLIINYFQYMMRNSFNVFKEAGGIWIEDKYVPLLQLLINLLSSIILLKIFGLAGVFMGTILSNIVIWFYSYPKFVYKKLFNKNGFDYMKEIIPHIIIFTLIITISYIINMIFNNTFISILIALILPNIILYFIYFKTDEFKYYTNLLTRRLKKWKKS